MAARNKSAQMKQTLLLTCLDGEYKIDLPAGGMVTFGPAIPGPYALRVYGSGGKNDLQAVFTGVRSFRNMTILIA